MEKPGKHLARVRGVDRPALDFDEFYGVSSRRLLPALVLATGDLQDAQDCLQEAFARAAARWRTVRSCDNPEAWVRRVAMNLAVDGHRRRRVRRRIAEQEGPPAPAPAPGEAAVDVVRAVAQLSSEQRQVVVLHHLLDLPVAEVARELGRSENTVKTQLVRARARLVDLLSLAEQEQAR
ncbi:MAG: SigE family polymerase sigma factor [Frankiales bacterium]|nr:SigE family polymerase sigma factor [Frankiales bacterium]